ncbi:MAG: FadR/GntR family transcriptional regulator [bacterium]
MRTPAAALLRTPLAHQVGDDLVQRILSGEYRPGETLPSEAALAGEYGVSRPVVREALKLLWAQGLVVSHAGRGAVVQELNERPLALFFDRLLRSLEPAALLDLLAVRRQLESMGTALAAEKSDGEQLAQLRALLERMGDAINDFETFRDLDVEFHILLARCSKNEFLYYLTVSIRDSLAKVIDQLRSHDYQSSLDQLHRYHARIVDAIEAGDPQAARRAMEEHFDHVIGRIETAVNASTSE